MKKIKKLLYTLSKTPSLKERVALLEAEKDDTILQEILVFLLNPYGQFYIQKLPTVNIMSAAPRLYKGSKWEQFKQMATDLQSRDLSGHSALVTVMEFLEECNEDERWVYQTVILKAPLGFGASIVNKVWPGLVPEFDVMLADAKMPKLAEVKYPLIAQHKLDGFRAIYSPKVKGFIGRNGRMIRNENLQAYFAELIKADENLVLDGELYSDTLSFNEIASVLNSEDKDLTGIHYCVYDTLLINEWEAQKCSSAYESRLRLLTQFVQVRKPANVRVITSQEVKSETDVQEFYKESLGQGYEGLMLKSPHGVYQWKRVTVKSQTMMKLKPTDDYDGKIVGYEEGEGKLAGSLGVLIASVEGIKNPVKVGSGFTEEERDALWGLRSTLVGQWIKIKAFEITEGKESLRFPIFLAVRDSKD